MENGEFLGRLVARSRDWRGQVADGRKKQRTVVPIFHYPFSILHSQLKRARSFGAQLQVVGKLS
jgi:hypothetical protein